MLCSSAEVVRDRLHWNVLGKTSHTMTNDVYQIYQVDALLASEVITSQELKSIIYIFPNLSIWKEWIKNLIQKNQWRRNKIYESQNSYTKLQPITITWWKLWVQQRELTFEQVHIWTKQQLTTKTSHSWTCSLFSSCFIFFMQVIIIFEWSSRTPFNMINYYHQHLYCLQLWILTEQQQLIVVL